ncbi:MAG TPA: PP2C family serine/threonine-protein phosphatase [Trichocoleus sp.]
MNSLSMQIQCPNPECLYPTNSMGQEVCDRCQTPLLYRHLWAVGQEAAQISVGTTIGGRYAVLHPQIWLDSQPGLPPDLLDDRPDTAQPYLTLYPYRLHLPGLYGFYAQGKTRSPIFLLDHVPIDAQGNLLPAIETQWSTAAPARQLYWLWQILQLWQPLSEAGVARSLLSAPNLRVEGWLVRLCELIDDEAGEQPREQDVETETSQPSLKDLATLWLFWLGEAQPQIREALREVCQQMQAIGHQETGYQTVANQLNALLLEQAAQLPLKLTIAGATVTGPQRTHNEDVCYPDQFQLPTNDGLMPYVGIVCDGIGGHEGGEVASQLALRSLQSLLRTLLIELANQDEPLPPPVICDQLISVVRIVNNQISAQNDAQGRELRQRMGTTLVMALQIPQKIPNAIGTSHELYLVHVGDSRAYWLTSENCQLLTVDDDVIGREVRLGRSLYQEASLRSDAGALIQALGTRDADTLHINVQRFIVEEDGLLLLCSDGLSDNQRVEQAWESITSQVIKGKLSLEEAVQAWVTVADEQNGHDNASIVLMHCQVNRSPHVYESRPAKSEPQIPPLPDNSEETELTESARALLYDEYSDAPQEPARRKSSRTWTVAIGLASLLFIAGVVGMTIWRQLDPTGFQQTWERVFGASERD